MLSRIVEHLLAKDASGVDNVIIEIDNEEVDLNILNQNKLLKQSKNSILKIKDKIELVDGKRKYQLNK